MIGHLLLIEDNEMLGSTLVDNFQMENYSIDWTQDGKEGLQIAERNMHDLIILDVMLPSLNGFDILKRLRESSDVPVLILSARSQVDDRIQGLQLRADDYLAKPFQFKELELRVQSILRRQVRHSEPQSNINIGQAQFDFKRLSVTTDKTTDTISEKELLLLKLLLSHKNQVVSRDRILDFVWGAQNFPSARTIDNFIVTLRKWIEIDPSQPQFIISHRGVGYSLNIREKDSK